MGERKMKKLLIVYYSWSNGNTRKIAQQLQKSTDADIAEIETAKPYAGSYQDVVNQGKREVDSGYQPDIKPLRYNIADYDVIAIGTPMWWYTMAPAVLTYLKSQDWGGKTIIPFMTNGGWPGHVISDMQKACKGAKSACEMQVQFDSNGGNHMETSLKMVEKWIESVKRLCE